MNYRPLRVANLLRDELGLLIARELEFPDALVTITEIEVKKKMDIANVLVSVIPSEKAPEALKTLRAAAGDLQHKLLRRLNIKPMPRLQFAVDHGPENAATVEKRLMGEDNDDLGHVVK